MKFKPGVIADGAKWQLGFALAVCEDIYKLAGYELTVTSMLDGTHNPGSLHPKGLAADLRVKNVDEAQRIPIYHRILGALRPFGFDVCWEGAPGATPATTGAHIHVEYDPHGRVWPAVEVA